MEKGVAWDCDPFAVVYVEPYDDGLMPDDYPFEDWQVMVLDRFGDRSVNPTFHTQGNRLDFGSWNVPNA